jgi:hypothetical protein
MGADRGRRGGCNRTTTIRKSWGITMGAADELFEELGIKRLAFNERSGPCLLHTFCGPIVEKLIRDFGVAHARSVLIAITQTGDNGDQLVRPVILAMSDVIRSHPAWPETGSAWLLALDKIRLRELRAKAKATKIKPREAIATLLCVELAPMLVSPKESSRKPSRVERPAPLWIRQQPMIKQNIELGAALLKLKATVRGEREYYRLRRFKFGIDDKHAARCERVARMYAAKPEITERLTWAALAELALPMPDDTREKLEARILAGQRLEATEIRRARGSCRQLRPRQRSPVRMAA